MKVIPFFYDFKLGMIYEVPLPEPEIKLKIVESYIWPVETISLHEFRDRYPDAHDSMKERGTI